MFVFKVAKKKELFILKLRLIHYYLKVPLCKKSTVGVSEKLSAINDQKTYMSSKEIRKCFIDYFKTEKIHTYVHSSPVFLNNDPTLLFVNAGMNQFKSLLLDAVPHSHEFHNLKRVVNSQKCIRISGKHNDLDQVGNDFHHHTFFEMLGNWSFGDYFKKEACEMAWELLTKVYGLPENQLYITYFGGDEKLKLPADEECKNIWLDIGVHSDHIFPFGSKENFWDMGDTGPCGPCTEIHYDYVGNTRNFPPAAERLNAGRTDLIEIWNLVFTQYKREQGGKIERLLKHNVDTGMGLERLTAILQGTTSNYNTDIFIPLFQAIQNNFHVRPYKGLLGENDVDGIDTAYRIIADHCRMFTVAISDGLFPDSYDAGHILRKIIRKAAYMANSIMKTRPGRLSTLVPHVVETLDFFPELEKHMKEVIEIVNDEEKMLHQVINRGRKARNKMAAKNGEILDAKDVWELYNVYGLDEKIIYDLSTEIGLKPDWTGYQKIMEQAEKSPSISNAAEKSIITPAILSLVKNNNVPETISFEAKNGEDISSEIVAIIHDEQLIEEAKEQQTYLFITSQTNFSPRTASQVSDIGDIFNEDVHFKVSDIYSEDGYIFHYGKLIKGNVKLPSNAAVTMSVNKDHRLQYRTNHTATHMIHAALRQLLPYTSRISSFADSNILKVNYSAKAALTSEQIERIETFVNEAIAKRLPIEETSMLFGKLLSLPNVAINRGDNYPSTVKTVTLGDFNNPEMIEPCEHKHLENLSEMRKFAVINSKSVGATSRTIFAITGDKAEKAIFNGKRLQEQVEKLKENLSPENIQDMEKTQLSLILKDVKKLLHECNNLSNVQWTVLRNCETILKEMKFKLISLLSITNIDKAPSTKTSNENQARLKVSTAMKQYIIDNNIQPTQNLSHCGDYMHDHNYAVKPMSAVVSAIFQNGLPLQKCETNQHCTVITTKSNFFSTDFDKVGDKGIFTNEGCLFTVTDTYQNDGYIFHEGWVEKGVLCVQQNITMEIDKDHRKNCSLNFTGSHLLHSALQKVLGCSVILSHVAVGSSDFQLNFHSQATLSFSQLQKLEDLINQAIQQKLEVVRSEIPGSKLRNVPNLLSSNMEYATDPVPIIFIGDETSTLNSAKLCYGKHACNTSDLENFVLISSKSAKNMEKIIRAATGKQAKEIIEAGKLYNKEMQEFISKAEDCLKSAETDFLELWDLMKEIKIIKNRHETDLPVILFRKHQDKLTELTRELNKRTDPFIEEGFNQIKNEMKEVLKKHENSPCIICRLNSLGDGKRLVNYALKSVPNKPCIFFARDGHKTVICSCSVPREYISSSFSALLWIQPVATFLEGRARSHNEDSERTYSIESYHVQKIDKALEIAENYAKSHL